MTNWQLNRRGILVGAAGTAMLSFLPGKTALSKTPVKITAAEAVETLLYLPLYVAAAKGFFAQEGLDVTIYNAQQRTIALRAVVAGDALTYNGDPAEPALARKRGVEVKNIGALVDRAAVYILGKAGIPKEPKEWGSRMIIVPRPPHTAVSLIQMTLSRSGYRQTDGDGLVWQIKDGTTATVRLLPVIAGSELAGLLGQKADMTVLSEPQVSEGVADGMEIVTSFSEQFGPFFFTSFAVLEKTIKEKPELVQAFANAMTKAMIYGHKHPDAAVEVAIKRYPSADPKIVEAAAQRIIAEGAYPENMLVTKAAYDNNFDRLLPLTRHPAAQYPFDQLMDLSFAEKAAKAITPGDVG
jgi:NitT/TauT family transport system substrate-binding protein